MRKKRLINVQYRIVKTKAKKVVAVVKNNAYERLYKRLDSKVGEREVFKVARAKERCTRYLSSIRCIKDEDDKVLIMDTKLKER